MIDPEMSYCPQCRDEYRAGVAACVACGVPLVSGEAMLAMERARRGAAHGRKGPIGPNDQAVTVLEAALPEVKRVQALLEGERIGTAIVGQEAGCGKGCGGPKFQLQVRLEEARDAMHVLAVDHRRVTGLDHHDAPYLDTVFDPEAGEAVCPACGFAFSTATTTCPDCGLCFG
ncbi:MAG: zinc ribbon-containing (seleno)protein DG [Thermodesulfobacteriota bacterium]